jgi:peptidyl-prolyl cis-trans isomerase SurA
MKVLISMLALFASFSAYSQATNIDRIIAKVDNYYILKSEVEGIILQSKSENQSMGKCQALESIAIQKLLVAKAEIDSVIVEPDVINEQLDARMQQMARMYGGEKNIVEQFGKSIETFKSEVRTQVAEQLIAQKMQQTITEGLKVTPNEVKRFFNKIPTDSIPAIPKQVEIAQIVRLGVVTKIQKDELRQRLRNYKKQIEAGEDFASMAKIYSEDLGSRETGGDLGWAKRGQMVPEFEATAMKMQPNEMSDVVESDFGYHLIQTIEIRGQEYHARHILLRPDYNRLELSGAKSFLDSLSQQIAVDTISFESQVRYSEDEETALRGGFISSPRTGTNMLNLDQDMEPNLYFMIDTMRVGTVSATVPFRSQEGKTGYRLIYYKKSYEPHTASLNSDYELIQQYAMAEKKNRQIEKWFKEAMEEVFVKIDPEYENCNILRSAL